MAQCCWCLVLLQLAAHVISFFSILDDTWVHPMTLCCAWHLML
jgi:hypothetical protein